VIVNKAQAIEVFYPLLAKNCP